MKICLILLPGGRTLNVPHLGIAYIATFLKKQGYPVKVLDFTTTKWFRSVSGYGINYFEKDLIKKIIIEIEKTSADIYGFSINVGNMMLSLLIANELKKKKTHSKIIFGGPQATIFSRKLLATKIPDLIVISEGEETLLEIIKIKKLSKSTFKNIQGISYLHNKKVYQNPIHKLIKNLDSLPFPDWSIFNLNDYKIENSSLLPAILSRGCPFYCIFCTVRDFWQNSFRYRSISSFVDELQLDVDVFGADIFRFNDSTFNFNRKLMDSFCMELKKRKMNIIWGCYARPDKLSYPVLKNMFNAGCRYIYLGIESGNQLILDIMNKEYNINHVKKVINIAKNIRIKVLCSFMVGFPGESYETIEQTIKFIKNTLPDSVYIFPYENRISENQTILEKGYQIETIYSNNITEDDLMIRETFSRIMPRVFIPWQNTNVFFRWEDIVTKARFIEKVIKEYGLMDNEVDLIKDIIKNEIKGKKGEIYES